MILFVDILNMIYTLFFLKHLKWWPYQIPVIEVLFLEGWCFSVAHPTKNWSRAAAGLSERPTTADDYFNPDFDPYKGAGSPAEEFSAANFCKMIQGRLKQMSPADATKQIIHLDEWTGIG